MGEKNKQYKNTHNNIQETARKYKKQHKYNKIQEIWDNIRKSKKMQEHRRTSHQKQETYKSTQEIQEHARKLFEQIQHNTRKWTEALKMQEIQ